MVGTTGFEPVTSWSRTRRTTKLCYVPIARNSRNEEYSTLEREIKERHLIAFAKPLKGPDFIKDIKDPIADRIGVSLLVFLAPDAVL